MPEHHRENDESEVWDRVHANHKEFSEFKTTMSAAMATINANYEHIRESLAKLEAMNAVYVEQANAHAVDDGKQHGRIDTIEKDVEGLFEKIREHVDNHKFWLGFTLGIPAVLLALWEIAARATKSQ